jgi:hypothetical protein
MNDKAPQYLYDNFEQHDIPKFRTSIGQNRSNTETRGTKIGHDLHIERHSISDLNYFKTILTEK